MDINIIWNWILANWPWIAAILSVIVAVAIEVARGNGKELATQVVALITAWSKGELSTISQEEVNYVAGLLYDKAPDRVGPIPWKVFISRTLVQQWAWDAWQKAIALLSSERGISAKRGLIAQRKMRGVGIVVDKS